MSPEEETQKNTTMNISTIPIDPDPKCQNSLVGARDQIVEFSLPNKGDPHTVRDLFQCIYGDTI